MGTSAIYDVFDQQFPVFYQTFFSSAAAGTLAYSRLLTTQIALEALLMIPMPWIINKIGAKNGLICYGILTFLRITLSAIAPNFWFLTCVRLIASFEMPLFLVSTMKYIAGAFDLRLYATIYTLAFNFAKQISLFIFSTVAGDLYDSIGFQHTYFVLAALVAIVTILAIAALTKEDPVQAGEVKATEWYCNKKTSLPFRQRSFLLVRILFAKLINKFRFFADTVIFIDRIHEVHFLSR